MYRELKKLFASKEQLNARPFWRGQYTDRVSNSMGKMYVKARKVYTRQSYEQPQPTPSLQPSRSRRRHRHTRIYTWTPIIRRTRISIPFHLNRKPPYPILEAHKRLAPQCCIPRDLSLLRTPCLRTDIRRKTPIRNPHRPLNALPFRLVASELVKGGRNGNYGSALSNWPVAEVGGGCDAEFAGIAVADGAFVGGAVDEVDVVF
jgi:hypothetical protein